MAPSEGRLQAAGLSAQTAHARVRRKAEALIEEMEEITSPNGVVNAANLDSEDSMVIAVAEVIASKRSGTHG